MNEIEVYSHGKINLSLDVLYKRDDGYHEIESIMQEISLKDRILLKKRDKGIVIRSNSPQVPLDINNLAYRAWEKLNLYTGQERGIEIYIDKTIPIGAGLAGGSSNAASTLKGLNKLWDLGLSTEELMKIGLGIGADVPFCILGGTALAKGIGEVLRPLKAFRDVKILICNPGFEISTEDAYRGLDLDDKRIDTDLLLGALEKRDIGLLAKEMKNKMEKSIIKNHPLIEEIKKTMIKNGALGSLMSGSGPTVFGIFEDEDKMKKAKEILIERFPKTFLAKTI